MNDQTLVSVIAIVVSGAVGISGIALSLRKFWESDSIERALRRTKALQMLGDEELMLNKVETECASIELLVHINRDSLGETSEHLESETARIVRESRELLAAVRRKRTEVEKNIQDLRPAEIEAVIARSYHGHLQAQAQLYRTSRSRQDTIEIYQKI
ncbi:MAG: hypothetical protein GY703_15615 [Gammaproteobacteria bacterium]|nr:hypothetical protein [Gammaproteobacteria bacterium]